MTVTVSISVKEITGVALARAKVTFALTGPDVDGAVIAPQSVDVVLDDSGIGTINLWPNSLGTQGTRYQVIIRSSSGAGQYSGFATVPQSNCYLHNILALDPPASVDDAQAAALAAQGYASQAATSAASAASAVSAHISDPTDAHAASAIGFTAPAGMTSTNVQAAIEEAYSHGGGGGASAWGGITGTLSSQTDLQSALNAKADSSSIITDHTALSNIGTNTHAQIDTALTRLANTSGTNTGDQTSVTGNAGTATALQTGRTIDGQTFDGTANITVIAPGTHAATSKTTPVDADELPLADSAASFGLKKLTWANVKSTLKSYFDAIYQAAGSYVLQSTTVNGHALSANVTVTASDVGLGSVTNDAQTKAAIVPNTAPSAGQVLVGNAGGTAYAPVSMSGDATLASTGAITVTKTNGSAFVASATTDTTNAANISSGTLPAGRLPALTGDVTSTAGSAATTLATVNANVGSFTNANITVDAKGRVTAAASGTGGGLTVGTTAITSGTDKRVLFDNAGVVGESASFTWDETSKKFALSGYSLTGTSATSQIDASASLNTTGSPDVWALRVSDTARGGSTKYLNIYGGASGASSVFSVDYKGQINTPFSVFSGQHTLGSLTSFNVAGWFFLSGTQTGGMAFGSDQKITWDSTTTSKSSFGGDTGIGCSAAGVAEINSGTKGTLRDLALRYLKPQVFTVGTLASASTVGNGGRAHVSDASGASYTFGATVSGSGSRSCPVFSDNSNWKEG